MKTISQQNLLLRKYAILMFMFLFISENIHSQQDALNSLESLIIQKNNSNKLLDSLVCYKDGSPHWREVYTYNTKGLCIEELTQDFTTYNYWVNTNILSMNYNQNGLCTEELLQKFDKNGEPYVYRRTTYFYNNFDLDSEICQIKNYNVDTLRNDYKKNYVYKTNKIKKYLTEESYYSWIDDLQSWKLGRSDTFIYNSSGLLSKKTIRQGQVKMYNYTCTYNENNLLTEVLRQNFILLTDSTVNDTLFTYSYDKNGYIKEMEYKFWDKTDEKWMNYKKYIYEYYDDYQEKNQTFLIWYPFEEIFKCQQIVESKYDIDGNELRRFYTRCNGEEFLSYVFYYSDFVDIADNNTSTINSIRVYPNPSDHLLKIETGDEIIIEINIYDLSGKYIKSLSINEINTSTDISDLHNGMYFIQIKTEKSEVKMKFIKL